MKIMALLRLIKHSQCLARQQRRLVTFFIVIRTSIVVGTNVIVAVVAMAATTALWLVS